jgi:hypothetical protein
VLCDGVVVGRIMKAAAAPVGEPWLWTLAFGQHEDRWPTHGYEPTREAAMAAFAKSLRRELTSNNQKKSAASKSTSALNGSTYGSAAIAKTFDVDSARANCL